MNSGDCITVHGNNLTHIARECNENNTHLTSNIVKENMKYYRVPATDLILSLIHI